MCKKTSLVFKVIVILSAWTGITLSFFSYAWDPTAYMVRWRTFLYFTIMANLFASWSALAEIVDHFVAKSHGEASATRATPALGAIKHACTIWLIITFLTFYGMIFGGVWTGIRNDALNLAMFALQPSNITVHLITPLFTVLDYLFFAPPVPRDHWRYASFVTITFPFAYAVVTVLMSLGGVRFSADGAIVPYFFMDYVQFGWVGETGSFGVIWMWVIMAVVIFFVNYPVFFAQQAVQNRKKK